MGGWPTVKYFNKETGLEGGTYVKKTDKAMCEELGNKEMMSAYVEEYGNTSLCSVKDGVGCTTREKSYIEKMSPKPLEALQKEATRLEAMDTKSMKTHLGDWVIQRKKILRSLVASNDEL